MALNHQFVSSIPDDPAAALAGKVLPSHWNEPIVTDSTAGQILFAGSGGSVDGFGNWDGNTLTLTAGTSASKAVVFKAATSQSANITEWQDSSGTVLASVSSSGTVYSLGATGSFSFLSENAGATSPDTWRFGKSWSGNYDGSFLFAYGSNNAKVLIDTTGAITAFGGYYLNVPASSSSFIRPLQHGNSYVGFVAPASGIPGNNTLIAGWNSVIIDGSTGEVKLQTNYTDRLTISNAGLVGIGDSTPDGQLDIQVSTAATIGLIVQGAASQTANLQEWRNSSGTVLASISAAGVITTGSAQLGSGSLSVTNAFHTILWNGAIFGWSSSSGVSPATTNFDIAMSRNAAGVLEINSGTAGTQRDVLLRNLTASGGITPASMADGSAANGTIYYSTTASKLVYKDSGGTVNALY